MSVQAQLLVRNLLSDQADLKFDYSQVWQAMLALTRARTDASVDEIWLLEHAPVFTQGKAGKDSHILDAGEIPVVRSDRGGQVTYHGPGQIMVYLLINLSRRNIGVRALVELLEQAVIRVLAEYQITAYGDRDAPGVYVDNKKIAALGLRISRGCSYHGLCFNYDFDASPFLQINPCGYPDLKITQLSQHVKDLPAKRVIADRLVNELAQALGYSSVDYSAGDNKDDAGPFLTPA